MSADAEKQMNELENIKTFGSIVHYGSVIQLLHMKSNKMLTVKKKQPARWDRRAMLVCLEDYGSEGSWFCVNPFYKHRQNGDPVMLGDRVVLTSVHTGQVLNVTQTVLGDELMQTEVNALLGSSSCWRIHLYLSYEDNREEFLKGGDVIRLFHTENEKFLTCDEYTGGQHVFLRTTFRTTATTATSSKALWEVEVSL
ncbi:unnamed protein product [Echinostoma caproni]|uniref:Inositol 1,4,5-trisphosphate receptor n=1 Tax=Echinostoma caproni TaxID=27848 RepID=A0A183AJD9_9TREM|nr:unnamed protein product [Echinostoma caproni]